MNYNNKIKIYNRQVKEILKIHKKININFNKYNKLQEKYK